MKRTVLSLLLLVSFATAASMTDETPDGRLLSACMSSNDDDDGAVQAVSAALAEGANVNVQDDRSGQTPLMASVLRGKTNLVQFLLKNPVSKNVVDETIAEKDGYTPPHGAGFQGRADIFKLLVAHYGKDIVTNVHSDGFTPFHRACWGRETRHAETVRYLLKDVGVDVNLPSQTEPQKTCWDMTNNPETKQILQEYGAEQEL